MDLRFLRDVAPIAAQAGRRAPGMVIATVVANRSQQAIPAAQDHPVSARLVMTSDGLLQGTFGPALDRLLIERAGLCLAERKSQLRSYNVATDSAVDVGVAAGDLQIFFEVLSPPPVLVIVGAGHIALPLASTASVAEFEVVIVDDRPEFANLERFPSADRLLVGPYRPTLARVEIDADTFVVLVTRGHVHDQACLEQVIDSSAAYIGMIGSRRRVRTVVQHALTNGHDPERLRRVFAPIGLDIAAHTPAEIAIAIMAEIISVRRGGHATSLALGNRLGI